MRVGDEAMDFSFRNVDGEMVSMADYESAKGFIVVFTCNTCPWAQKYEDRINALNKKYQVARVSLLLPLIPMTRISSPVIHFQL